MIRKKPIIRSATLRGALEWSQSRAIAGALNPADLNTFRKWTGLSYTDDMSGVWFADGSRLVVVAEGGFGGSELTPPDPYEVKLYIVEATP